MASSNMSPLRNFLNSIKNSVYNISIDGIGNTDINASSLFNGFPNLYRTITLNDMNYVTDMSRIFNNTKNLSQIPNYNFNTSNVTNMSYMFRSCSNLTTIPNFNTSNVTNMSWMFEACYNLTNIPNFDTSKVTNMWYTFSSCSNLTNVPNFNTSNVTYMGYMFLQCYNLITIPNFNTSKVINMSQMFQYCRNLITIPNFNTSKVTNMSNMFKWCDKLTTIPNFNTSKVTDMSLMFNGCYNLTNIPILNITNLINMSRIFSYCDNLSQASVNNIVTSCSTASKVTNKNWTNIGFNVAEGSKWNTWIRTAPDYMNAVNIGWQNIGDAISPAYKRRIMVGDNLTGKNIYFEPYDLNEFGNYCRNTYYKRADNTMDMIYLSIDDYFSDIVYQDIYTFEKENSSYCIDIPSKISNLTNTRLYCYDNQGASISTNVFKINNNINIIVENITHRFPYDDNAPVGDETSYRAFYIEDENIRPIQEGDVLGPGTKLYFVIPDDACITNGNELFSNGSNWPFARDISVYCGFMTISMGDTHYGLAVQTGTPTSHTIYSASIQQIVTKNESYFEWPEDGKIYTYKAYGTGIMESLFEEWTNSEYILVDTRTLYRNVKVGDKIIDNTEFYFTFPDDMYLEQDGENADLFKEVIEVQEGNNESHWVIDSSKTGNNLKVFYGRFKNNVNYNADYYLYEYKNSQLTTNIQKKKASEMLVSYDTTYCRGTVIEIDKEKACYKYIWVSPITLGE